MAQTRDHIREIAMKLKATAMPMQLGIIVHLRPILSAAMDAGITTTRLTTDIAEKVAPATHHV